MISRSNHKVFDDVDIYQVKLSKSFWKTRSRNRLSDRPYTLCSVL